MIYSFSLTGANIPAIKEFEIEKDTAVKSGRIVYIDENGIVNKEGGTILGVAAEDHSGEKDLLNTRANGNKIRVDITQAGVYKMPCPVFESIENSQTSFVCNNTCANANIKGSLVLVAKGHDSTNSDYIGKRRKITAATVSGNKTVVTLEGDVTTCKGDRYAFVPAVGFNGSADSTNTGFSAVMNADSPVLTVVSCDTNTLNIEAIIGSKLFN